MLEKSHPKACCHPETQEKNWETFAIKTDSEEVFHEALEVARDEGWMLWSCKQVNQSFLARFIRYAPCYEEWKTDSVTILAA